MKTRKIITLCVMAACSLGITTHITAATPVVKTNARYARGATMAFGRMSVTTNGVTISQRGFCYATHSDPTVDDNTSTKTMAAGSGTVYVLEQLQPATMYYMRAYVKDGDNNAYYGDQIKFCTVPKGNITYSYNNGGSADENTRINNALTQACDIFNNLTSIKKHFNVGYGSGTPTADCNYNDTPWMNVGPNSSYQRTGTIMHEMQHGLGVINYSTQWNGSIMRSGNGTGQWLGDRVSAFLDFWDNKTGSLLNGDTQHMWPYGVNGAHEDDGTLKLYYANAMLGQALGEDGLQHTYSTYADPYYSFDQEDNVKYYLKNESADRGLYTSYLMPTSNGILKWRNMTMAEIAQNDSAAWYITFTPDNQYYQFRNAATGQYMTYSSGIKTAEKATLTANENWHLMKGRVDVDGQRGYWIIRPTSSWTPVCLQANANGATAATTFNLANSAEVQRWLILTQEQAQEAETKAMAAMKVKAENALAQVKAFLGVPHSEDVEGADQTLTTTVDGLSARITAAISVTELVDVISEAQAAGLVFLQSVTATDPQQPFDLTYMMVNPTVAENSDGWTGGGTVSYGCVEFYEKTFDFNQTVKQLPAGTYQFCAQGFQRPGSTTTSYSDYKAGTNKVSAFLYAGSKVQKIHHICDTILTRKIGVGNEAAVTSGKYVPDDMQAASAYFKKGLYENRVVATIAKDNSQMKMGIRSASMSSGFWAIFNDFRLYFYGKMSEDILLGIETMKTNGQMPAVRQGVYTLDGRRLSSDATLRPGLYLIDGRKVIVK